MPQAEEISRYDFQSSDELLLDANVWLFVYGPHKPGYKQVDAYSQALARIKAAHSRIYIDVLIVSEFINTYARLKWKQKFNHYRKFKQFRQSKDFKPVAQDIAADLKYVLRHCTRVTSGFEELDIDSLIADYAAGNSDFNDQVLAALCRRTGWKLVTDDSDFKGQGITVITANRHLLA
jgi:predicted nucleic acid-binding protein